MAEDKITIVQGDTKSVKFTLTQNGSAWDVSSYTHKLWAKNSKSESGDHATGFPITGSVGGASNNEVTFTFTHAVTKALTVQKYYYDYKLYASDKSLVKTVTHNAILDIEEPLEKDI